MKKADFVFNYRVRNWTDSNRALVRRGSLTIWVDEQALSGWKHTAGVGRRGRPRLYADAAIECALVIKAVFHLSLRATQGFLESVLTMMRVQLPVPDYTMMCRRQRGLDVQVGIAERGRPQHIVIDTTGLKVFGNGEWNLRKHGMRRGRRRTWRKLHLGVDETTKEIVAVDLTTSRLHDSLQLPAMLSGIPGVISQVSADKAYDSAACYDAILARDATPATPPRRRARLSSLDNPPPARAARDDVLRCIEANGRYAWRTTSGATRQSVAENAVSRFKALVGVKLASRGFESQRVEAAVRYVALNRMAALGLPVSERVPLH